MAITSKKFKKDKVGATRKNNQSNPKETSEVTNSSHYNEDYRSGYQSAAFSRGTGEGQENESYRSGISGEDAINRMMYEKPESYAQIRLIRRANYDTNKNFAQFEKETHIIPPYTRFFLQQTSYVKQEKYQILQTFGDFKIFFYDKQPEIKNYSGYLLNSKNHDWVTDFEYVYENYLRGTQAVKLNAISYLIFDNVIIEGYIIMAQFNRSAIDNNGVPFSFQMIITDRTPINLRDVKERNRLINEKRDSGVIEANQKKLPSDAISIISDFFDSEQIVGVYDPPSG